MRPDQLLGGADRKDYPPFKKSQLTGTIKLYNKDGYMLKRAMYRSLYHRQSILNKWREVYGFSDFQTFYYQVIPDVKETELRYRKAS